MGVARMAARSCRISRSSRAACSLIAHVVRQRPRPVERGRPQIGVVPGHDVARRMTDAAADALDAGVGCHGAERLPAAPRRNPRAGSGPARSSLCASCHLSKNASMSTARSLTTVKLRSGSSRSLPSVAGASATRVRQVQRGRPFTTMAQEPHMPTRQAKRYARVGILLALDFGDDVEHGLVGAARHGEGLEMPGPALRARPRRSAFAQLPG